MEKIKLTPRQSEIMIQIAKLALQTGLSSTEIIHVLENGYEIYFAEDRKDED